MQRSVVRAAEFHGFEVTKFGSQLTSAGGGVHYWVDSPDSGAHDVDVRLVFTLLFPK